MLVCSVALDALQIARTLRFAASIGIRAGELGAAELESRRTTLDQLLEQTQIEMRELQVLLRQRSADILARVEQDLKTQVESYAGGICRDAFRGADRASFHLLLSARREPSAL